MTSTTLGITLRLGADVREIQTKTEPAYAVTNSIEPVIGSPAVQYVGSTMTIDPEAMRPEQPYRVTYRGKPAIAIKHMNGHLAFYRLP
jgi:hypothetical protein